MFIMLKTVPQAPDRNMVVACIRACVWASIEGRPFCVLSEPVRRVPRMERLAA